MIILLLMFLSINFDNVEGYQFEPVGPAETPERAASPAEMREQVRNSYINADYLDMYSM